VLLFGGAGAGYGQIVINEIMQNPSAVADNQGEWFELYNAGSQTVDLNGWTIKDDGSNTFTISSSTQITAGGYLVFGINATTSTNGGVTVDYDYPNGFSLGNGDDELVLLDGSSTEQDRVNWDGGPNFPDPTGASMALKATNLDNNVGSNWCTATTEYGTGSPNKDRGTPGAANDCPTAPDEIFEVQGSGAESAHVDTDVTLEDNVVTAVGAGGFFMQTPTSRSDSDADTSDGIFVLYDGATTINVGDQVDVTGTVKEFFAFTRIDATGMDASVTVDASNQTLPDPVEFGATVPSGDPTSPSCAIEYECYEGMRIRIATGTVNSGSQFFRSDPVAEMYITPTSSRAFREKGLEYPGDSMNMSIPVWDTNPEVFELDPDKLGLDNVSWAPGTTFAATGVLGYEFGGYELWPTELTLESAGAALPRPVRQRTAGEVSVASLNLLNLNADEDDYATKLAKLSRYIREVLRLPDVIGVQEAFTIEALMALASRIHAEEASATYTAYLEPGNQSNGANVGFLVRSGVTVDAVTQHNKSETFVNPTTNNNDILHDRPPLQLDASVTGIDFSVIVIHNRSLINIDTDRVQVKRLKQAESVAGLAQARQDSKLIIVGDYNAYQFTDGYTDIVGVVAGDFTASESKRPGTDLVNPNLKNLIVDLAESERYSYIFGGNLQALDHALVNAAMQTSVVEMVFTRGNADAAEGEEFNAASPLYASDHDGLVVFLSAPGRAAPPALLGPPDPVDPGVGSEADLSLHTESETMSESSVRYHVSISNAGPSDATNVVVSSSVAAGSASVDVTTSGCDEDPHGVPECGLGRIPAGRLVGFTIDARLRGQSSAPLSLSISVDSSNPDPTPDDSEVDVRRPVGRPAAPSDLVATAISGTEIELGWTDNSHNEAEFAIFLQGPGDSRLRWIGAAPANATSAIVDDLVPNITYNFALEARNGSLHSERTGKATATTWVADATGCSEDEVLCLDGVRFEVAFDAGDRGSGFGRSKKLTSGSGDFWFFSQENIEVLVKLLDGCSYNGHYWVFAAGLTDVGVTMTAQDLRTSEQRTWTNPRGTLFEPILEVKAFASCADSADAPVRVSGAPADRIATLYESSLSPPERLPSGNSECESSETTLCLLGSRYEVRATWKSRGSAGVAGGIPRTSDTGLFWFFDEDDVELAVKVLDGCDFNGHRWLIVAGLTDVGVEVTVTDTVTGEARVHRNSEGKPFKTLLDVVAFSCSAKR